MIPQYSQFKPGLEEAVKANTTPSPSLPLGDEYLSSKFSHLDPKILSFLISKNRELAREDIRKGEDIYTIMQLADVKFLKKEYGAAEKLYAKAISIKEDYLLAYKKLINTILISNAVNRRVLQGDAFENFRTRLNTVYNKYVTVSEHRPDIVHNYIIFRLSFFLDDKELADESISSLNEILKVQTNNFLVLDTLGFIYLNLKNDNEKAKEYFEKSLQYNNSHIHSVNNIGVVYLNQNNPTVAETYFKKAISINPLFEMAYENLASLYINQRKLPQAIDILNEATQKNVKLSNIWRHQLGWLLIQEKDFNKAKEVYDSLITEEPLNSLLYNNLGICYLNVGERKKAIENFKKSISVFKQTSRQRYDSRGLLAFYNLARRVVEEDNIALINQIIKDIQYYDKDNNFAVYLLGVLSLKQNDYDKAKEYFLDALKSSAIPEIYIGLSFIYSTVERNYEASIEIINEAIEKKITNNAIYNNLAFTYIKMGDLKAGRKILDIFGEDLPVVVMPTKGLLLIREGKVKEGIKLFENAFEGFNSDNDKATLNQIKNYELALHWFRNKKFEIANEHIQSAKEFGDTYMRKDVDELDEQIKKVIRKSKKK